MHAVLKMAPQARGLRRKNVVRNICMSSHGPSGTWSAGWGTRLGRPEAVEGLARYEHQLSDAFGAAERDHELGTPSRS